MAVNVLATNVVTAMGRTTATAVDAMMQGRTGLEHHRAQETGVAEDYVASTVSVNPVDGLTPLESLAVESINEAMSHCDIDITSQRTMLVFSSTKGNINLLADDPAHPGYGKPAEAAAAIARHLGMTTHPLTVSNACISGLAALIAARRLIERGQSDTVIVCGAELIGRFIISGFQSFKALSDTTCKPFDADRHGLNLGEGAATIILSNKDLSHGCKDRDMDCKEQGNGCKNSITYNNDTTGGNRATAARWQLTAGAMCNDANHISGPSRTGEGAFRALKTVLETTAPDDIALVSAHGTATPYNDEMESIAIARAGLDHKPVNALKGYLGHTLGAAGVVECALLMECLDRSMIAPTLGYESHGVSRQLDIVGQWREKGEGNAFVKMLSGFGGTNAAVAFTRHAGTNIPEKQYAYILQASVNISPHSYTTADGTAHPLPTGEDGIPSLTALYRALQPGYPKFFKMDPMSRLAFLGAELLLGTPVKPDGDSTLPLDGDTALIVATRHGCIATDLAHIATIGNEEYFPSPSVFVYTLPNIAAGEVAIRHRLACETACYLTAHGMTHEQLLALAPGAPKRIITATVDHDGSNDFNCTMNLYSKQE